MKPIPKYAILLLGRSLRDAERPGAVRDKPRVGGKTMMRGLAAAILAAYAALMSGCTSVSPEAAAANDPFEPANRGVYAFDERFDKYVVLPIAGVYLYYMPVPMRHGLHNFLLNLDMPVTFANNVLQGDFAKAGSTLGRFAFNSTVGLGGFVDVATPAGIPYHSADFGQTLALYGVPEGPFLVLPIIGPDPPRDFAGDAVDLVVDPLFYLPMTWNGSLFERFALTAGLRMASPFEVHARNIVLRQELQKGSVDPYVTMRSVYRQLREQEIEGALSDRGEPRVNPRWAPIPDPFSSKSSAEPGPGAPLKP